jgi:hypothetical protein
MGATLAARPTTLLRHSSWDAVLVALSFAHAAVLGLAPSIPVIALGLWWNANTVAHNFIHTPFFRARELNILYSIFSSALLGIPQTFWRHRHLSHHSGKTRPLTWTPLLVVETTVVLSLWMGLAVFAPRFFLAVYVPGYVLGLCLCFLQGHFEHARGTTSHYGRIYNACFFNDGYHVEHHLRPGEHWTCLPLHAAAGAQRSRWPPVLRWLEAFSLDSLERVVLQSTPLQRFVLARHERALKTMVSKMPPPQRVTIVGGGLFPRTALILRKLLPEASLTIVERQADHIEIARRFLDARVTYRHETYEPAAAESADLVIVPLGFVGDRRALYEASPAPFTLIHDWMWNTRRDAGVPVSWLLLKRLNLVTR